MSGRVKPHIPGAVWGLALPWGAALVAVVLAARSAEPMHDHLWAVIAVVLLGCAAHVVGASHERSAPWVWASVYLAGSLAAVASVEALPRPALWWLAVAAPAFVAVAVGDQGHLRWLPSVLAVAAASVDVLVGGTGLAGWVGLALAAVAVAIVPTRALAVVRRQGHRPGDASVALVAWAQSSLVACVVALMVLQFASPTDASPQITQAWASAAFALALTIAFGPARALNTKVGGGSRTAPAEIMTTLAGQLANQPIGRATDFEAIGELLRSAWDADAVTIVPDPVPPVQGSEPGPDGSGVLHAVPLVSDQRTVGWLIVQVRHRRVLEQVLPMLDDAAGLLGTLIVLSDLGRGIEDMRVRILSARDEERRLLTRELTDRVTPQVTEVQRSVRAAARNLESDATARPRIGTLESRLAQSAEDVRRIARAMLPSALDEGDVVGAMRELLRQPGISSRWTLHAEGSVTLEPTVQRTLYLVLADLLDVARSLGLDAGVEVALVAETADVRLRVSIPGHELSSGDRRRLREAVERHAADFVLTVRGLPGSQGVELVVRR